MKNKNENHNSIKTNLKEGFKSFLSIFGDSVNEPDELEDYIYSDDKETADIARILLENSQKIEQDRIDEVVEKKRTRGRPAKSSSIKIEPINEIRTNNNISFIENQRDLDR